MKQIRNSIFETNSSSSHTLIIDKLSLSNNKQRKTLPGNYLLELTDEFSGMDFDTDWVEYKKEQSIEQKLQYMYVYCASKPKYLKLFEVAVNMLAYHSDVTIDYSKEDKEKTYYYNKAIDYISDNMYFINYESRDHLDEFIDSKQTDKEKIELIYDIITIPSYIITNNDLTIKDI